MRTSYKRKSALRGVSLRRFFGLLSPHDDLTGDSCFIDLDFEAVTDLCNSLLSAQDEPTLIRCLGSLSSLLPMSSPDQLRPVLSDAKIPQFVATLLLAHSTLLTTYHAACFCFYWVHNSPPDIGLVFSDDLLVEIYHILQDLPPLTGEEAALAFPLEEYHERLAEYLCLSVYSAIADSGDLADKIVHFVADRTLHYSGVFTSTRNLRANLLVGIGLVYSHSDQIPPEILFALGEILANAIIFETSDTAVDAIRGLCVLLQNFPEFQDNFCRPSILQRGLLGFAWMVEDDKFAVNELVTVFLTSPIDSVRESCLRLINLEHLAHFFGSSFVLKEQFCETMKKAIFANRDFVFEFFEAGIFDTMIGFTRATQPFSLRRAAVVSLFGCFGFCDYTTKERLLIMNLIPGLTDLFETLDEDDLALVLDGVLRIHEHFGMVSPPNRGLYCGQLERSGVYDFLMDAEVESEGLGALVQKIMSYVVDDGAEEDQGEDCENGSFAWAGDDFGD
jgi:hypothetical protein